VEEGDRSAECQKFVASLCAGAPPSASPLWTYSKTSTAQSWEGSSAADFHSLIPVKTSSSHPNVTSAILMLVYPINHSLCDHVYGDKHADSAPDCRASRVLAFVASSGDSCGGIEWSHPRRYGDGQQ